MKRRAKTRIRKSPDLILGETHDDSAYAYYYFGQEKILMDAKKLTAKVQSLVSEAKKVGVDLGDSEDVWICKFSSIISHEIIHHLLYNLEGNETSHKLDALWAPVLRSAFETEDPRDKSYLAACDFMLWSDAFNPSPLGDTWFK